MEKITIKFDEENLTLGDLEDFEDVVGVGLFEALKPVNSYDENNELVRDDKGRPVQEVNLTAKAMKGLVWITLRADRPGFTLDDARNVKVAALEFVTPEDDEAGAEGNAVGPVAEAPALAVVAPYEIPVENA